MSIAHARTIGGNLVVAAHSSLSKYSLCKDYSMRSEAVLDTTKLFDMALGLKEPWYVKDVSFDAAAKLLTLKVDFTKGSRFPHPDADGLHPVYDTETKSLRHLNFFQ